MIESAGFEASKTAARKARVDGASKCGLSWQITPIALTDGVTDPDLADAKLVFDAMKTMKKINIAPIEAALRG